MSTVKQKTPSRTQLKPEKSPRWPLWDGVLLLKEAGIAWWEHNSFRFGASLAYYTVASLAPLVIIVVGIVGLVFGQSDAPGQFVQQVQGLVGPEAAAAVDAILKNAQDKESGIIATVLGIAAFLGGLTAVFFEIKAALNALWGIEPGPEQNFASNMKKMLFSFGLMGVLGFLLLVSLFVSAGLSAVNSWLTEWQPGLGVFWQIVNFVVSFGVAWLLFALLFKYVPDVQISFHDVWVGAAITTVLFAIGKVLIGIYLGRSGIASSYGAAGSIVVLLLWVYYSALILFFGAEFTKAYANRFGSRVKPADGAKSVEPKTAG